MVGIADLCYPNRVGCRRHLGLFFGLEAQLIIDLFLSSRFVPLREELENSGAPRASDQLAWAVWLSDVELVSLLAKLRVQVDLVSDGSYCFDQFGDFRLQVWEPVTLVHCQS